MNQEIQQNTTENKKIKRIFFFMVVIFPLGAMIYFATLVTLLGGVNLFKEPDRQKAIKLGISLARKGDTIGIFGKGHEKSINYNGVETPWSDLEAIRKVLASSSHQKLNE